MRRNRDNDETEVAGSTGTRSYLIAFELNDDSLDYGRFFLILDSLAYSMPIVSSVWLVKTSVAEELLADALLKRMGPHDKLVMAECPPEAIWRMGLLGPRERIHRIRSKMSGRNGARDLLN